MIDVSQTIISQYANSPRILAYVDMVDTALDPRPDLDKFYTNVWNINTAMGFGLDIWGRILGITRLLYIDDPGDTFGFDASGVPFDQGTFGLHPAQRVYSLSDDAYRVVLLLKAVGNISASNIPTLNSILKNMMANRGRCYALEVGTMRIRYVFEFDLQPYERALLQTASLIPHPAGVGIELYEIDPATSFGFDDSGQPFDQGTFVDREIVNVN